MRYSKSGLTLLSCAALALISACSSTPPRSEADLIFSGGDIVTVDDSKPSVEAVALKNGRIQATGSRADILAAHKGPNTRLVDLAGKTLLPGFLDPHSHYINALTVANQVNVFAPPAGPGKDVPAILEELRKFRDSKKLAAGELVMAYGYDDTAMPGGRLLNRDDLDSLFPNNPVMVGHVSLHGAVLNSAALKKYGVSAATPTPPGGVIVRKKGSMEPDGLLMETAFLPIFSQLPKPNAEQEVAWTRAGQLLYAAAGITTAHEGATHANEVALMQRAAAQGANLIDIVAYPFITELDEVLKDNPPASFGKYKDRLKLGGVKVTIDGSPQGKTAFFTTPYLTGGPGGEQNWRGEPTFPEETVKGMVKKVYDLGLPLNLHANGDAAIDLFLRAHEFAAAGSLDKARRTTVIHSQFVRRDQLDKYLAYRVIPSFYTEHTFYFADAHIKQRGKAQAEFISPMKTALAMGLHPTNHTDFNVAPLDQMFVVWTAVNRVSRSGQVVGAEERVSPLDAIKAITINAAYQYFEEDSKGSITPSKLADLVILDRNPLKVPPLEIKDIRVLETFKEGQSIYKAP
ncbi:amidohydrolase [Paucibacter sp. KBW04]|uniref:amidohydrolase n=1 Tax=Paucibacter sp. KBW04 TaxID=2153361 RepID=UPI000F57ABB2|nr:amidohydrolase [Paucibacter sp. KBW04]RQO55522.1 amidohydrolase [Paucibacter sp. KBW04]